MLMESARCTMHQSALDAAALIFRRRIASQVIHVHKPEPSVYLVVVATLSCLIASGKGPGCGHRFYSVTSFLPVLFMISRRNIRNTFLPRSSTQLVCSHGLLPAHPLPLPRDVISVSVLSDIRDARPRARRVLKSSSKIHIFPTGQPDSEFPGARISKNCSCISWILSGSHACAPSIWRN